MMTVAFTPLLRQRLSKFTACELFTAVFKIRNSSGELKRPQLSSMHKLTFIYNHVHTCMLWVTVKQEIVNKNLKEREGSLISNTRRLADRTP